MWLYQVFFPANILRNNVQIDAFVPLGIQLVVDEVFIKYVPTSGLVNILVIIVLND
jgi:hypothetical protein